MTLQGAAGYRIRNPLGTDTQGDQSRDEVRQQGKAARQPDHEGPISAPLVCARVQIGQEMQLHQLNESHRELPPALDSAKLEVDGVRPASRVGPRIRAVATAEDLL